MLNFGGLCSPYTQTFLQNLHFGARQDTLDPPKKLPDLRQETQTSAQIFEAAGQRFLMWLGCLKWPMKETWF